MPSRRRYLLSGAVPTAIVATVALAACRLAHVLVPNWWCVGLPALVVALAYAQSRVDHWAAHRRAERDRGRA